MLAADAIEGPSIHYAGLLPMLILFGAACLGVLVEAGVPRRRRFPVQLGLSLAALVAALVAVIMAADKDEVTASGAIAVDGPGLFLQGSIIVLGLVALLLISERTV